MNGLRDKVIIITWASSWIWAETALLFANEGVNIVITYKENRKGAEEIGKQINDIWSKVFIVQADLMSEIEAKVVIDKTIQEFGKIDILINNAGRYIDGDEWNGNNEIWIKSLQQNLVSVMNISKYAIEQFQKQKSWVIVNISSRYSIQGQFDALAYSTAKAWIANLTQSYAKLLAPYWRVNAVSPWAVNTGYWLRAPKEELEKNLWEIPLNKLAEPIDIAEMVLFLASEKAKYITWQNIFVDWWFNLK